jgi:hypothetical protein
VAIRQFLKEDPTPTAIEGDNFVKAAAHHMGVHPDRAKEIYQEEVSARWRRLHRG